MVEPESWTEDFTASGRQSGLARATGWAPTTGPSIVLGAIGGATGVALSIAPFLLMHAYVRSFVSAAAPDSAFNVLTLGAVACLLLAVALAVVSLVLLIARTLRVLGLAYLGGLLSGGAVDLLLGFTTMR